MNSNQKYELQEEHANEIFSFCVGKFLEFTDKPSQSDFERIWRTWIFKLELQFSFVPRNVWWIIQSSFMLSVFLTRICCFIFRWTNYLLWLFWPYVLHDIREVILRIFFWYLTEKKKYKIGAVADTIRERLSCIVWDNIFLTMLNWLCVQCIRENIVFPTRFSNSFCVV